MKRLICRIFGHRWVLDSKRYTYYLDLMFADMTCVRCGSRDNL